jgi:hypothetical protein
MMSGHHSWQASGGAAVTVRFSVTVRQVREDGSEVPVDGELAAALAGPAEQFAGMAAWAAEEARYLDLGEREQVIGNAGRELQRRLLQATFGIDSAREQRAAGVTSAAGIRHGTVEEGHGRGVTSVFGPVRVTRMAYRNRREPNLYPADARWILPGDPYSLGMRALAAFHLAAGGFGRPRRSSRPAPASRSAAPSSPAWPRISPPGRMTSTPGAPGMRRKRSSRTAT